MSSMVRMGVSRVCLNLSLVVRRIKARERGPGTFDEGGRRGAVPPSSWRDLNNKEHVVTPEGSEIWYDVPGSGGFGPPSRRDPAKVRTDVSDGYVSAESARRDYGVEI